VKRVFERQAELSKTADHATIKQAARETSRRGYATILADAQAPAMETDEGGRVSSAGGVKRDSTEVPPPLWPTLSVECCLPAHRCL